MKRILVLLTASLLIFGCAKKQESENKPVSASAAADTSGVLQTTKDDAPPSDVSLGYELKKDQHYNYRLTSVSASHQSIVSDSTIKQNSKQTITYVFDMAVKDVESDKVMDISVTVKSIKLDADVNGQKFSYQSGMITAPAEKARFADNEAMVNNPFSFRMNDKGEVLEIYRLDKIVDKFLELQGMKDSVKAEQKKQFQTNMAESAIKPLLQQVFRTLPKNKLGKDSTWKNVYPSRLGVFAVENIAKYKLVDFQKLNDSRLAVIEAGLEISSQGKNKVSEKGVDYDFKKPEAEGSGRIYFNLAKGCVQNSKTNMKVRMSVTMKAAKTPRGPMKATRNDLIETSNILELLP